MFELNQSQKREFCVLWWFQPDKTNFGRIRLRRRLLLSLLIHSHLHTKLSKKKPRRRGPSSKFIVLEGNFSCKSKQQQLKQRTLTSLWTALPSLQAAPHQARSSANQTCVNICVRLRIFFGLIFYRCKIWNICQTSGRAGSEREEQAEAGLSISEHVNKSKFFPDFWDINRLNLL